MSDGGLGENLTALYLSNPALANALRTQAYGYASMRQGADDSPIRSPWQGINRVAQALIGGYFAHDSQGKIKDAYDKGNADLAGALQGLTTPAAPQMQQPTQPDAQAAPQLPGGAGSPQLSYALHQMESGGSMQPGVVGDGGKAGGVMQVHQPALDDVNKANGTSFTMADVVSKPQVGKWVGDAYAKLQEQRFPGRPDLALAAYNAGPTATQRAVDSGAGVAGLPPSTQAYVQKGLGMVAGPGAPSAPDAAPAQMPATGAQAPMIQQAMQLQQQAAQLRLAHPGDPRFEALAKAYEQRAGLFAQFDQWVQMPDGTLRNVRTNEIKNAPTPAMNYQRDPQIPGMMTSPGNEPVAIPTPRGYNVPGVGFVTADGGGTSVAIPQNLPGIAQQNQAEAQGKEAGKDAVTVPALAKMVTEANQGIGTIQSARAQLAEAAKGGIPTGYFSPALAVTAQAAKSLGIDTKPFGIEPGAVSSIGAAQKSLAITSGSIIRVILGPDTPITDTKLEHYIHATPGLATDPGALDKIFNWVESQLHYNHNMALHGLQTASKNGGIVPSSWQAEYMSQNGTGPIYNPTTDRMEQPAGRMPMPEGPGGPALAPGSLPRPTSPAEAARLPKGTQFIDPNGVKRVAQ